MHGAGFAPIIAGRGFSLVAYAGGEHPTAFFLLSDPSSELLLTAKPIGFPLTDDYFGKMCGRWNFDGRRLSEFEAAFNAFGRDFGKHVGVLSYNRKTHRFAFRQDTPGASSPANAEKFRTLHEEEGLTIVAFDDDVTAGKYGAIVIDSPELEQAELLLYRYPFSENDRPRLRGPVSVNPKLKSSGTIWFDIDRPGKETTGGSLVFHGSSPSRGHLKWQA